MAKKIHGRGKSMAELHHGKTPPRKIGWAHTNATGTVARELKFAAN